MDSVEFTTMEESLYSRDLRTHHDHCQGALTQTVSNQCHPTNSASALMTNLVSQLAELISQNVATIVSTCDQHSFAYPSTEGTFSPESDAFRSNADAAEAANIAIAAALQLVAALLPPQHAIVHMSSGHLKTAALGTTIRCHVPEILREAGPEGLHADDIAAKTNVDGIKLGRLLRLLANHHVFKEVKPDVFASTRLSTVLDTGKTVESILADPDSKHDGTSGFPAWVEHGTSITPKASAAFYETFTTPPYNHSDEPNHAPFHLAYGIDYPLWEWFEQPGRQYELKRFGRGMRGVGSMQPPDIILNAYPWHELKSGSIVVDVGAGIGTSAMLIARHHEHLRLVVQDRGQVVEDARTHWNLHLPNAVSSGQVAFQDVDFFAPQPPLPFEGRASLFILKNVLHNWSNTYASTILKQLRKAATKDTKLLIVGSIMGNLCRSEEGEEGYKQAPAPLLPNYGAANEMGYTIDMTMLMLHNAQERTLGQMKTLVGDAGWRIEKVMRSNPPNNFFDPVIAVPI